MYHSTSKGTDTTPALQLPRARRIGQNSTGNIPSRRLIRTAGTKRQGQLRSRYPRRTGQSLTRSTDTLTYHTMSGTSGGDTRLDGTLSTGSREVPTVPPPVAQVAVHSISRT